MGDREDFKDALFDYNAYRVKSLYDTIVVGDYRTIDMYPGPGRINSINLHMLGATLADYDDTWIVITIDGITYFNTYLWHLLGKSVQSSWHAPQASCEVDTVDLKTSVWFNVPMQYDVSASITVINASAAYIYYLGMFHHSLLS